MSVQRLSSLFIFLVLASTCFGRTWTSREGRSFEGELIRQDETFATIRRDDDKGAVKVAINSLSESDQQYLKSLNLDRVRLTPDISQMAVPNGGNYCGPASASNALAWLANHGYDRLLMDRSKEEDSQKTLITILARKDYMDAADGAGISGITRGLKKYIEEKGYEIDKVVYEGWRSAPSSIAVSRKPPGLAGMKECLTDGSILLINIGWYKAAGEDFERTGGHWITYVGQERNLLLAYDPAPRSGKGKHLQQIVLTKIEKGKLTGKTRGLPLNAAGYLKVESGLRIKSSADFAILDGYVCVKLR